MHAFLPCTRDVAVPVIEGDDVLGVLGVADKPSAYDETEVHELQLIADDLWRIVLRRRAEETLAAAKAAAEAANRAKSTFLANMSHEIRTPLNAITGLAYLAQRSSVDPTQRDRLGKIKMAARHLVSIIDDILDISKIEAGKLPLEATELELDNLMSSVASLLGERAAAKGLDLFFEQDPALGGKLKGDPLRIGQILANFVGNAIKFTEQGSVTVAAHRLDEQDGHVLVRFEVRDTGIGVPEADRARLFLPFDQQDDSTTRRYGGTGLGLAISQRLTALMGGEVGVEQAPGGGSVFCCQIPLGRVCAPPPLYLKGRRALLQEPGEPARRNLVHNLEALGVKVEAFATAAEAATALAVAAQADTPFDWLIASFAAAAPSVLDQFGERLPARRLAILPNPGSLDLETITLRELARIAGFDAMIERPIVPAILRRELLGPSKPGVEAMVAADQAALGHTPKVLLVEDNPFNQEVALEVLRDAGIEVHLAKDGREAVAMTDAQGYDLILMDIQMPHMDGIEATRQIREREQGDHVPIIAMTANAYEDDRQRALAAGMDDHLPKPIEPEVMLRRFEQWLPGWRPVMVAPQAAETTGWPGALAEVDVARGLNAAGGDKRRYFRLLQTFMRDQVDDTMQLSDWLLAGRLDEARKVAHDLKSVAGSLGAGSLSQRAGQLQQAILAGSPVSELLPLADEIIARTAVLAAAIRRLPPPEAAPSRTQDATAPQELIEQLRQLVEESNMAANSLVQQNDAVFGLYLGSCWPSLRARIEQFDYPGALAVLRDCQE